MEDARDGQRRAGRVRRQPQPSKTPKRGWFQPPFMSSRVAVHGAVLKLSHSPLFHIAVLVAATRMALTGFGVLAYPELAQIRTSTALRPLFPGAGQHWLAVWDGPDTGYYIDIVRGGYTSIGRPEGTKISTRGFFPLYPLLVHVAAWGTGDPWLAGFLVSNFSLVCACYYIFRLVELDHDRPVAMRAVMYQLLLPVGFMESALMTEGLYLWLAVAAFYAARRGQWAAAGAWGGLAAMARPTGFLLSLPLAWMYWATTPRNAKARLIGLAPLLPLFGALLVCLLQQALCGDFLAYVHVQCRGMHHYLSDPFGLLYRDIMSADLGTSLCGASVLGATAVLVATARYQRPEYLLYVACIIEPALMSGTASGVPRYLSTAFPLAAGLACAVSRPGVVRSLQIGLALVQGGVFALWVAQLWQHGCAFLM